MRALCQHNEGVYSPVKQQLKVRLSIKSRFYAGHSWPSRSAVHIASLCSELWEDKPAPLLLAPGRCQRHQRAWQRVREPRACQGCVPPMQGAAPAAALTSSRGLAGLGACPLLCPTGLVGLQVLSHCPGVLHLPLLVSISPVSIFVNCSL